MATAGLRPWSVGSSLPGAAMRHEAPRRPRRALLRRSPGQRLRLFARPVATRPMPRRWSAMARAGRTRRCACAGRTARRRPCARGVGAGDRVADALEPARVRLPCCWRSSGSAPSRCRSACGNSAAGARLRAGASAAPRPSSSTTASPTGSRRRPTCPRCACASASACRGPRARGAGPTAGDPCAPAAGHRSTRVDVAVILYTSGTTGHPKGAMLDAPQHRSFGAALPACMRLTRTTARRWRVPASHVTGLVAIIPAMLRGRRHDRDGAVLQGRPLRRAVGPRAHRRTR